MEGSGSPSPTRTPGLRLSPRRRNSKGQEGSDSPPTGLGRLRGDKPRSNTDTTPKGNVSHLRESRQDRSGSAPDRQPTVLNKRSQSTSLGIRRRGTSSGTVRSRRAAQGSNADSSDSSGSDEPLVVKMRFPDGFPHNYKAVRLSRQLTIQECIFAVEALLNFPVPNIEGVGLVFKGDFLPLHRTLGSFGPLDELELRYSSTVAEPRHVKHKGHIDARQSLDLSLLISPENPKKLYKNMKTIGAGGFAEVCLAWNVEKSEREVIKKIELTNVNLKYVLEEVINHKSSAHEHIVAFREAWFVREEQQLWVALEYMAGGSLTDRLAGGEGEGGEGGRGMPEWEMSRILRAVALALALIHSKHRLHRDIKSDNILFGSRDEVKLADFGFATKLTEQVQARQSLVGTTHWMAPEMLLRRGYGQPVDVWALGIVAVELCDGEPPFWQVERKDVYRMILHNPMGPQQPQRWSKDLVDFIALCLIKDPTERPVVAQLLDHPFLQLCLQPKPKGFVSGPIVQADRLMQTMGI